MLTKLLYLEDFNLLTSDAIVVNVVNEEGRDVVILDQTIFYPQGGGQPYDQGIIESPTGKFLVEEVRFVERTVKHIGKFVPPQRVNQRESLCTVNTASPAVAPMFRIFQKSKEL